ncbi:hypothetical protein NP493_204g06099 [Ridgeia piscesae]|uniref:2-C-methyl-D-erythritol 4-phosphate cytidylyltransferase, chloroplastic n=1 Tax=Ridgeia piscesae TaxID=27915 RepID=A0AAD9P0U8_RIDPI|nr:hypothetical protein NP493_204g06099 [Ridgeia piscesae]
MDFKVCAVLPAAGCGQRMGTNTPKQFSYLLGRPLISYCLESFERVPWISDIVVTVSPEGIESMQDIVSRFNHKRVTLVAGASVRHRSIYNGVKALNKVSPEVVIVHDAVRPFVDEDTLREVSLAAWEYGSSGAVRPLVSTVIATDLDGFLDHSLDRSKYRSSEMPQAFCYDILCEAYQKATDYDFDYGTECLHLVNKYTAARTRLIEGPEHLWKVTYKKDMFALEGLLKEHENSVGVFCCDPGGFERLYQDCCNSSVYEGLYCGRHPKRTDGNKQFCVYNNLRLCQVLFLPLRCSATETAQLKPRRNTGLCS